MAFHSILYRRGGGVAPLAREAAREIFRDLNIDQIIAAVIAGRGQYDLGEFYCSPLDDLGDIAYRQEIAAELEEPGLRQAIGSLAAGFEEMRRYRRASGDAHHRLFALGWFFEAARAYGGAVERLAADLRGTVPRSPGLRQFAEYVSQYRASAFYREMATATERLRGALGAVEYSVVIRDLSVTVRGYAGERGYSPEILRHFAKFRGGADTGQLADLADIGGASHIDAQILEAVAELYPEAFSLLEQYCTDYREFLDPTLQRFDREVQFYIAYLDHIRRFRAAGLPFCYPRLSRTTKAVCGRDVFDLALADKLLGVNATIVRNDFRLRGRERVLLVSGPNQGGKTTFARTFGQLHYFARLGLPVAGSAAELLLCDRLFTHFEREEKADSMRGKLQDDLLRIRRILDAATAESLVIMNEIFSSTALEDAVFLAGRVMEMIVARDCLCVCVTFLDELQALGEEIVSMVSTVMPDDPAVRTFKLVRRPADGRAFAIVLAEKYRLSYRCVIARIGP